MTKFRTSLIILCIGLSADCSGPATATDRARHIKPEPEVLTQAEDAGFDYIGKLRRAERGETEAVVALINFSSKTDAAGALAHGWVLLELRKMIGKDKFSNALAHATKLGRMSALDIMEVAATYE
jgi:hypothetical protein